MARSYNGSTDFHSVSAVGVAAAPLTLACWFNPNGVAVNETLMTLGRASGNGYFRLSFQGAVANDPVVATATNTSNSAASSSVNTTQAADAWGHAVGVYASTTSRTAYWNGTAAAANATSIAAGTLANTTIGCFNTIGAQSLFFAGSIAHAAIWNVALAQDDITALAQGYSPLLIRPDALVAYYPLYGRGTGAEDWTGGTGSLTATGSPGVVDEPRIVYGRAARLILPNTVAAGNTIAVPAGSLSLTGFAPTIVQSANQIVAVPAGSLSLTGQVPTIVQSDNKLIAVPAGSLTLTGNAPSVVQSANIVVAVPLAVLTMSGLAPTVTGSFSTAAAATTPGGVRGARRKRATLEFDGKVYPVESPEHAQALLDRLKAKVVKQVEALKKPAAIVPPVKVAKAVDAPPAIQAKVERFNADIALPIEALRRYIERAQEDDDEDVLMLL